MIAKDLHSLVGRAASAITQRRGSDSASGIGEDSLDGLLFMGNPHETVPRALLLDQRLGAVDVLGWQIIRLLSNPDRTTAFPTYDDLQPLLRSGPNQKASRKTVARVIAVLRLTRWLTLGLKARNTTNGRMIGNIYVLHDEPLAPAEALSLDAEYLEYVVRCTRHANRVVQSVAKHVKEELQNTGVIERPTRLDVINQRASQQQAAEFPTETRQEDSQFPGETQSNLPSFQGELRQFPGQGSPSCPWKLSPESSTYPSASSGNSATTVRSDTHNVGKPRTAPAREAALVWSWPLELGGDERQAVELMLTGLSNEVQQAVLDEAAGRVEAGKVKSPMGFLRTLCLRAGEGKFQLTHFGKAIAAKRSGGNVVLPTVSTSVPRPKAIPRTTPEEAEQARQAMIKVLGIRR